MCGLIRRFIQLDGTTAELDSIWFGVRSLGKNKISALTNLATAFQFILKYAFPLQLAEGIFFVCFLITTCPVWKKAMNKM